MSNELRQRVPASASASENSEVSTSSSAAAKATPAGTTATPATTDKPVSAEDSQRAVRFLAMLSLAILVVPLATWYLTQLLFGVGNLYGAFAAVSAVNIIMIFTVCYAPKFGG